MLFSFSQIKKQQYVPIDDNNNDIIFINSNNNNNNSNNNINNKRKKMILNSIILLISILLIFAFHNALSEYNNRNNHDINDEYFLGDHSNIDYVLRDHPISATNHQYLDGRDWIVYKADDIDNINSYLIDYTNTFQGNTTTTINTITIMITITIRKCTRRYYHRYGKSWYH